MSKTRPGMGTYGEILGSSICSVAIYLVFYTLFACLSLSRPALSTVRASFTISSDSSTGDSSLSSTGNHGAALWVSYFRILFSCPRSCLELAKIDISVHWKTLSELAFPSLLRSVLFCNVISIPLICCCWERKRQGRRSRAECRLEDCHMKACGSGDCPEISRLFSISLFEFSYHSLRILLIV